MPKKNKAMTEMQLASLSDMQTLARWYQGLTPLYNYSTPQAMEVQ